MEFGPNLVLAFIEGAVAAAILMLISIGLSLVFGVMRIVNVAHGQFYMLGAVFAWIIIHFLQTHFGFGHASSFFIALFIAPICVGLLAISTDIWILKHIEYDAERTILATIGLLYIIQQSTLMIFGPDARAVEPPFHHRLAIPWFEATEAGLSLYWPWGLSTTSYKLAIILAAIIILLMLWYFMKHSRFGLMMRATEQDREMAQVHGIAVNRINALTFGLGAALASLGAVLIVPLQQAHYLMGEEPLLLAFIVVIIGGLGSLRGTLVAALLIGMSDGFISIFFSPTLAKILSTLLVAFILIFRPEGLFGRRTYA